MAVSDSLSASVTMMGTDRGCNVANGNTSAINSSTFTEGASRCSTSHLRTALIVSATPVSMMPEGWSPRDAQSEGEKGEETVDLRCRLSI